MRRKHPNSPSIHRGYTVHLTEQCDGWSIAVTRADQAAAFEVHHRDPQRALAMAKTVAATEGADLALHCQVEFGLTGMA